MSLLTLVPSSWWKWIGIAVAIAVVVMTIKYQSARIDSLSAENKTLSAKAEKLEADYKAANDAANKYHKAVQAASNATAQSQKEIYHVYAENENAKALLDTVIDDAVIRGMCDPFPGTCQPATDIDGAGATAASPYARLTVGDLVRYRADALQWGMDCRAKHGALVDFIVATE